MKNRQLLLSYVVLTLSIQNIVTEHEVSFNNDLRPVADCEICLKNVLVCNKVHTGMSIPLKTEINDEWQIICTRQLSGDRHNLKGIAKIRPDLVLYNLSEFVTHFDVVGIFAEHDTDKVLSILHPRILM